MSENEIHGNSRDGIDLFSLGHTDNDDEDKDEGPNRLQNYPSVNKAVLQALTAGPVKLIGALRTMPSPLTGPFRDYRLEFFASDEAGTLGYGQGQTLIGQTNVYSDFTGLAPFDLTTTTEVRLGQWATATATDADGNTSEFSRATLICTPFDDDGDGICNELEAQVPGRSAGQARSLHLRSAAAGGLLGDGNGDGIPDSQQAHVCSVVGITGDWLTLAVASGQTLKNIEPSGVFDASALPSDYSFPGGFMTFTVAGVAPGSCDGYERSPRRRGYYDDLRLWASTRPAATALVRIKLPDARWRNSSHLNGWRPWRSRLVDQWVDHDDLRASLSNPAGTNADVAESPNHVEHVPQHYQSRRHDRAGRASSLARHQRPGLARGRNKLVSAIHRGPLAGEPVAQRTSNARCRK